jgi:hypothetical protein
MNPRRFATVAAVLCETAFVACLAGFGSALTENEPTVTTGGYLPPSFTPDAPRVTAISDAAADSVDTAPVAESVAANDGAVASGEGPPTSLTADAPRAPEINAAADNIDTATVIQSVASTNTPAAPDGPKAIVEAALTEPSQTLPPETPPVQVAIASSSDGIPKDTRDAANSIDILGECLVADPCIDQYLWALYQRTPKEDTIKVDEQRKVTVKRKGKTVTVTRTFTKLVDENFAWKDPKAAEKAGVAMMDYVIGGMDRSFKLKLFYALHAAEEAGFAPGITSAFRDDYRQSIASGLKAASDRSYHGGSTHGGYGHGLAADVVSVKGETRAQRSVSTENLWKWLDAHEKDFGVGRPYLDRDPPHVAPVDGKEFASHRGTKAVHAASNARERKVHKAGLDESAVKRPRTARSSKVKMI